MYMNKGGGKMDMFDTLDIVDIPNNKEDKDIEVLEDNYLNQNVSLSNEENEEANNLNNIDDLIGKIEETSKKAENEPRTNPNTSNTNFETLSNKLSETNIDESKKENYETGGNDYSLLNQYGENFSTKEYVTNPAIGRDKEIGELIMILLTPEKSGILVGKPGIGKTAIVEGLGYRIKNGDVPNALKGYTIFKLNTASLTGVDPLTHELKIQKIVDNLVTLDKVIVFIDEIHTLIGNGENTLDFANIFKPVIDRGTVKLIGATTVDEYDRYILRDKAFVRRFQKVNVEEPTRDMVIQIMMGTYPKFEKKMNLKLKYSDFIKQKIMAFITDATSEFKRVYESSVRYPDIALTILQSAFSQASFENRNEVNIRDIRKAIETTKLIYPDVIKKELDKFNKDFKDVYLMETKQILKDEV